MLKEVVDLASQASPSAVESKSILIVTGTSIVGAIAFMIFLALVIFATVKTAKHFKAGGEEEEEEEESDLQDEGAVAKETPTPDSLLSPHASLARAMSRAGESPDVKSFTPASSARPPSAALDEWAEYTRSPLGVSPQQQRRSGGSGTPSTPAEEDRWGQSKLAAQRRAILGYTDREGGGRSPLSGFAPSPLAPPLSALRAIAEAGIVWKCTDCGDLEGKHTETCADCAKRPPEAAAHAGAGSAASAPITIDWQCDACRAVAAGEPPSPLSLHIEWRCEECRALHAERISQFARERT